MFNLAPEQPSTDSVTDLLTALWADAIALREAGDVARSAGPVPRDGTAG